MKMNNLNSFFNIQYLKKYGYTLFFSFIISFCFFSYINDFVFELLPKVKIMISSENKNIQKSGNYITILEKEENKRFYNLKDSFIKNEKLKENKEGLKFIEKGENGYQSAAVHLNNPENKISIIMKKAPNAKISFYNVGFSNKIRIESDKNLEILDISENKIGDIIQYFPFKESKLLFIYSFISYMVLGSLVFFFCIFLKLLVKRKIKLKFLKKYTPQNMVILIYILISIYISFKIISDTLPKNLYHINSKIFFGDQRYYWKLGTYLKDGDFNKLTKEIMSFRGYTSIILPAIAQWFGEILNINQSWLFYMLNNFFIALLLGYVLPELYTILSGKKAKNFQILLLFFIFSIFWKGMYYSVLVDLLGVTFLLYSLLLFLKYRKNPQKITAFFSGVCIAISSLNRGNYVLGVYLMIVLFIFNNILLLSKNKNIRDIKNLFFLYFFVGIILVCIPQIKINYENGKIGLFSYDTKGSWSKKDETLKDEIINHTLVDVFLGWPYPRSEITAQKIKKNFTNDSNIANSRISMKQSFSAFIMNPIDTIVMFGKKLFLALNIKTPEVYPDYKYTSHSNLYLFSLLNYFIVSTVFFLVLNKKIRRNFLSKKEIMAGSALFILYIIPQLLLHVEWRYFILLYLMIYYVFSFKFFDYLNEKNFKKAEYIKIISVIIFILFLMNSFYFDVF